MSARALSTIPALHEAALAAHAAGRLDEAARGYRAVLELRPDHPDALNNLSLLARDRGDLALALSLSEAAVAALEHPRLLENLGLLRAEMGDPQGARAAYARGLEIAPRDIDLLQTLLALLIKLEQIEEAEICHDRLLILRPDDPKVISDLGGFAHIRNHFDRAEYHYRRALEIDPLHEDTCLNLSSLGMDTARFDMAEVYARRALEGAPESRGARLALSFALLGQGRWAEAWPDFEFRILDQVPAPDFPIPRWRGEALANKRVIILCEQGLGDTLQFGRYAALVKARGAARVVMATVPTLHRLLALMDGVDDVVDQFVAQDPFDFWSPAMSLPQFFGTTPDNLKETLPHDLPYIRLSGPTPRAAQPDGAPLQVGVFWAGGHHDLPAVISRVDTQRSLPAERMLSLLLDPVWAGRVRWTILQKDRRPEYLSVLARTAEWRDPFADPDANAAADLLDTARLIAELDLVIGVDSALIHLSGALGRPTWLMDRWSHCWRWHPGAETSDWYPEVFRIFRQTAFGDWDPVLAAVREALSALAGSRSKVRSNPG